MSNRQVGPVAKELIAAKKRIEDPANWCQNQYVNDGRMCAVMALASSRTDGHGIVEAEDLLEGSARALHQIPDVTVGPVWVNDSLGHAAVMQMYDHAIARAISEGK